MARRLGGLFYAYVGMLVLPLVLLTWLNADAIANWWRTGTCPGGPMDREPDSCSFFRLVFSTVFGGWTSPIILSLLLVWCTLWTLIYAGVRYVAMRRRTHLSG